MQYNKYNQERLKKFLLEPLRGPRERQRRGICRPKNLNLERNSNRKNHCTNAQSLHSKNEEVHYLKVWTT